MPVLPEGPSPAPLTAKRPQAEEDAAAVRRADTADSDWFRAQRQPGGFFATTGWDAWTGLESFRQTVAARIESQAAGLDSPAQSRHYGQIARHRAELMLAAAERHAWTQRDAALGQDGQAREQAAQADMAAWGEDDAIATWVERAGRAELLGRAGRAGWDRATLAAALREQDSAFALARIERMVAADPVTAAVLCDRLGDRLLPAAAATANRLVATAQSRQRIEATVARLKRLGAAEEGTLWDARRAAARQEPGLDPAEQAAVVLRLDHDQAVERDQAEQAARAARQQAARQVLEEGRDPFTLAPELQAALGPGQFAALAAAYAGNGRVPFDAALENVLLDLARDDPARLVETDLSEAWGRHDTARLTYWQDQQRRLAAEPDRALLRRPAQRRGDRALIRAGLAAPPRQRAAMRAWIDARIEAGSVPTEAEIIDFAASLDPATA